MVSVVGALGGEVALDAGRDLGEVAVADDFAELLLGLSIPAAVQRRHMSPDCQRLTLRDVRRTNSIIDSIGFCSEACASGARGSAGG